MFFSVNIRQITRFNVLNSRDRSQDVGVPRPGGSPGGATASHQGGSLQIRHRRWGKNGGWDPESRRHTVSISIYLASYLSISIYLYI